jgi:hypothetical protein
MTDRNDVVTEVIDQRVALYGEPINCFTRIATVWSGILDHEIQAHEVPLLLMGLKLVRTQHTPDYSDNSDDIEGYLDIFRTIVGEDMVHARLSSEYWAQKNGEVDEPVPFLLPGQVPKCIHCDETEAFHNPVTGSCARPGFADSTYQVEE